jgi:hypothetical protein
MSLFRRLGPAALLLAASCVGSVGAGNPRTPGAQPPGAGGTGGSVTPPPGPQEPGDPPTACTAKATAWQTTLLTREQFIHSASDLLGFDVRPLAIFSDVGGRKATEGGVSLSALQVEERQQAAEAIAAAAVAPANLPALLPCDPAQPAPPACVDQFIDKVGARGFRRPLTAEVRTSLRQLFDAGSAQGGATAGVMWTLAGILQSPDFLYQIAPRPSGVTPGRVVPIDDHSLANRLAFFLWNSAPDADLRAAATAGQLRTAVGLRQSTERMLKDPRASRMREDYYAAFLKLDDLEQIGRDVPEYSAALGRELKASVLAAVHQVYQSGANIDDLLGSSDLFANDALAKVYGLGVTGAALRSVAANPAERRGVLTHPALMAFLAHADASDPIKRGVFMQEELLCQAMPDPAADIPDLPPLRPGLSTRARLEQHRVDPACAPCHNLFDPFGMAFENYDAIGRYRTVDQGVPVDSSGQIGQGLDLDGKFTSGMELIGRLPRSQAVRDCMARRWFEYAVSRATVDADSCALDGIRGRFRADGDLLGLLGAVVESETFRSQLIPQE